MYIYILRLLGHRCFLASSPTKYTRVEEIQALYPSSVSWIHEPSIVLEETRCVDDPFEVEKLTIQWMVVYGIDRVRGGSFTSSKLSRDQVCILYKLMDSIQQKCSICGSSAHSSPQCEYFLVESRIPSSHSRVLWKSVFLSYLVSCRQWYEYIKDISYDTLSGVISSLPSSQDSLHYLISLFPPSVDSSVLYLPRTPPPSPSISPSSFEEIMSPLSLHPNPEIAFDSDSSDESVFSSLQNVLV